MITMNTTEIPRSMTGGIDLTSLLKNSFVYFLFSGNEVVYVGQSTTVGSRLSAHSKDKEFDRASGIIVEPYRRLAVESAFIRLLKPKYNKTGTEQATHDDHILAQEHGIFVHDRALVRMSPLEEADYGMVMVCTNEQSDGFDEYEEYVGRVGYYDDDDSEHYCFEKLESIGLEIEDIHDDAIVRLCAKCGCEHLAIVYFGSWGDGYAMIPHSHLMKYSNDTPGFANAHLSTLFPDSPEIIRSALACQMGFGDLTPDQTAEILEAQRLMAENFSSMFEIKFKEQDLNSPL
jgi:hypothetical protein